MAPKSASKPDVNLAPKIIRTDYVKASAVSCAEDSGWREINDARVQEIIADLKAGNYGVNTLSAPSLVDGQMSAVDGLKICDNGKHFCKAMQILGGELQSSDATPDWVSCHGLPITSKTT